MTRIGGLTLAVVLVACGGGGPRATQSTAPSRSTTTPTPTTTETSTPRVRRVLVVGDSLATQLGVALQDVSEDSGLEVRNDGALGCGIVRGQQVRYGVVMTPDSRCTSWTERWQAILDEFDPDLVVVLSGFWDAFDVAPEGRMIAFGTPDWDAYAASEYGAAMDLLASRGAIVVWLQPPLYRAFVESPTLSQFREAHGYYASALDDGRLLHLHDLAATTARRRGCKVSVVNSCDLLCPADVFEATVGGVSVRGDGVHLTPEGAHLLAVFLIPIMRSIDAVRC